MKKQDSKLDIQFVDYDNLLRENMSESFIIGKYNELYSSVNSLLGALSHKKSVASMDSYTVYKQIINNIHYLINDLYNYILTLSDKGEIKEYKAKLIRIIKFETKRLAKLKKNINKVDDELVSVEYINDVLDLYDFDFDKISGVVSLNIINTVKKSIMEDTIPLEFSCIDFVNSLLEKYNVDEEVKDYIRNIYVSDKEEYDIRPDEYTRKG